MVNMDFEEAVGFLDSFGLKMEGFNLDAIRELAKISGLETEKLKVIHVAGTNGKGSTTAFISSILKEAGYLIGSYYSPHIFSIRERVRINGKLIAEEDFAKAVGFFVPFLEEMKGKPTYFELLTAVAIKYFLDGKVDFAVLETGMGGRLDATNIFESMVSAITSLDLEHTQYLGKAIDEIASESSSFSVPIKVISVGGADVQVFEFQSESDAKTASLTVSKDGTEIGTSIIRWIDTPHFYTNGKLIVLYVGHNPEVVDLLESFLGK